MTTTSALGLIATSVHTRIRKESVIHTSLTSDFSKKRPFTESVSPNDKITQGDTSVTQNKRVTHSLPVTLPMNGYTTQCTHAQSSKEVTQHQSTRAQTSSATQSDDIMDPYFIGEGGSTSLHTNHVTSPTPMSTSGPKGSTESNYVTHSSSTVESVTATSGISNTKVTAASPSRKSIFQTTTKMLPKHKRCGPLRSRFCTYMGYNQTRLSSRAGYRGQLQAEKQMSRFLPFIRANCSRVLRDFVCITYLPPCSSQHSSTVQPCRELCLRSKRECAPLMKAFEFEWPEYLDCEKFPNSEDGNCVGAHDTGVPIVPTQATEHDRTPG